MIMKNKEDLAKKAREHTLLMAKNYADEIEAAVKATIIYRGVWPYEYSHIPVSHTLNKTDSVSALFESESTKRRVCILNFASYKHPGGMFINGSMAQEESLCHESFLYNVLREFDNDSFYGDNRSSLNKGMYQDRALYTPNVRFFHNGKERLADVLTCAAPNYSVAYGNFSDEENYKALLHRVEFIKYILSIQKPEIAILGAWGCGVFKQDPNLVAKLWMACGVPVEKVIHAIPDVPTYNSFQDAFFEMFVS